MSFKKYLNEKNHLKESRFYKSQKVIYKDEPYIITKTIAPPEGHGWYHSELYVIIQPEAGGEEIKVDTDELTPIESDDKDLLSKKELVKKISSLAAKSRYELEKKSLGIDIDMINFNELMSMMK